MDALKEAKFLMSRAGVIQGDQIAQTLAMMAAASALVALAERFDRMIDLYELEMELEHREPRNHYDAPIAEVGL